MINKVIVRVKEPISEAIKHGAYASNELPKRGIKTKTGQVIYYGK